MRFDEEAISFTPEWRGWKKRVLAVRGTLPLGTNGNVLSHSLSKIADAFIEHSAVQFRVICVEKKGGKHQVIRAPVKSHGLPLVAEEMWLLALVNTLARQDH